MDFPLGAEAATIPIPINSNEMRYTIDDNSTVQFYKDFSGTTERIGPYHLSERAQHIKMSSRTRTTGPNLIFCKILKVTWLNFAKFQVAMTGTRLRSTCSRRLMAGFRIELRRIHS